MNLMPALSLRAAPQLSQKLKLTVGMRQALRILQMPQLDLKNFLEEELAALTNPEVLAALKHEQITLISFHDLHGL